MVELITFFNDLFVIAFWAAAVRMAVPLIFAAVGELFSERAGVLNIGLEGMILSGAFGAVIGAYYSGSAWIGLLAAMAAGGLVGLIHAIVCVSIGGNQVVSGAAINLLMPGLTTFLARAIFGTRGRPTVASFEVWEIPGLSKIPYLGEIFFQCIPLVYFAYLLIPVSAFILYKTTWGLKIRSVGEHPLAAETMGISIIAWRYGLTIACGCLAGVGGAYLSTGQLNMFFENMSAGRGFIALAAVIFGKWDPWRVFLATLFFGAAEASTLRLQALDVNIPYELVLMIPYLLTFIAFVFLVKRNKPPAALGLSYDRGAR